MSKEISNESEEILDLEQTTDEIIPIDNDLDGLIPKMNVGMQSQNIIDDSTNLIGDDDLLNSYDEIMNWIREDRSQVNGFIDDISNMVINEGDATSASKEALVNFVKMKTELADKAAKIADLKTRIKLKERDTFPRYLAASQNNTININNQSSNRRALIEAVNKAKKKDEK